MYIFIIDSMLEFCDPRMQARFESSVESRHFVRKTSPRNEAENPYRWVSENEIAVTIRYLDSVLHSGDASRAIPDDVLSEESVENSNERLSIPSLQN
jgi:hypothetical protein